MRVWRDKWGLLLEISSGWKEGGPLAFLLAVSCLRQGVACKLARNGTG